MNLPPLRDLLDQVSHGTLQVAEAERRLTEYLRAMPFEDLGFARVDHHRALRQGFPEVILGTGKTPAQISAIAARIVDRGHSLLVTRTDDAAYAAVKAVVPAAPIRTTAEGLGTPRVAPGGAMAKRAGASAARSPTRRRPRRT